jgi:hypothetical protein
LHLRWHPEGGVLLRKLSGLQVFCAGNRRAVFAAQAVWLACVLRWHPPVVI